MNSDMVKWGFWIVEDIENSIDSFSIKLLKLLSESVIKQLRNSILKIKRNENLQRFIAEASELTTSEKKAAKIRDSSERGLISIWRAAGPETVIIDIKSIIKKHY